MTGAVLKFIIFINMVNRIINTSRNERVTQQVYDIYLQMFDVCTLRHTAHIEAIPDLKNRITAAVETITPDLLSRVW